MTRLRIRTPSRLHFGLLGWGPHATRQFGGVGLMIDAPGIELAAEPAPRWTAEGPLAARALQVAERVAGRFIAMGVPIPPARITILRAPEEHVGLGVGTQLSLAVARAVIGARRPPRPLDRGARRALRPRPPFGDRPPRLRPRRPDRRRRPTFGREHPPPARPPRIPRRVVRPRHPPRADPKPPRARRSSRLRPPPADPRRGHRPPLPPRPARPAPRRPRTRPRLLRRRPRRDPAPRRTRLRPRAGGDLRPRSARIPRLPAQGRGPPRRRAELLGADPLCVHRPPPGRPRRPPPSPPRPPRPRPRLRLLDRGQSPRRRLRNLPPEPGSGRRAGRKRTARDPNGGRGRSRGGIPAMTDFRALGTIMGPAGLTAVFGMGTGVAPPVWSPGRRPRGGHAARPRRSGGDHARDDPRHGSSDRGTGVRLAAARPRAGGSWPAGPSGAVSCRPPGSRAAPRAGGGVAIGVVKPSAVGTGPLRRSPAVHSRPIDLVVFQEPSGLAPSETSSWRGLRA